MPMFRLFFFNICSRQEILTKSLHHVPKSHGHRSAVENTSTFKKKKVHATANTLEALVPPQSHLGRTGSRKRADSPSACLSFTCFALSWSTFNNNQFWTAPLLSPCQLSSTHNYLCIDSPVKPIKFFEAKSEFLYTRISSNFSALMIFRTPHLNRYVHFAPTTSVSKEPPIEVAPNSAHASSQTRSMQSTSSSTPDRYCLV